MWVSGIQVMQVIKVRTDRPIFGGKHCLCSQSLLASGSQRDLQMPGHEGRYLVLQDSIIGDSIKSTKADCITEIIKEETVDTFYSNVGHFQCERVPMGIIRKDLFSLQTLMSVNPCMGKHQDGVRNHGSNRTISNQKVQVPRLR